MAQCRCDKAPRPRNISVRLCLDAYTSRVEGGAPTEENENAKPRRPRRQQRAKSKSWRARWKERKQACIQQPRKRKREELRVRGQEKRIQWRLRREP